MSDAAVAASRAETLRQMKRPQEAVVVCEQALAEHPQHPGLLRALALAHRDAGNRPAAENAANLAVAVAPQSADSHRVRSIVLLSHRRRAALASAREAVRLAPHSVDARYALVRALIRTLRRREAQRVADSLIAEAPQSRIAQHAVAEVAMARGRHKQATTLYQALLGENPNDRAAQQNLAVTTLRRGRSRQAAIAFAHQAQENPRDDVTRRNLWASAGGSGSLVIGVVLIQLVRLLIEQSSLRNPAVVIPEVTAVMLGLFFLGLVVLTLRNARHLPAPARSFVYTETRRRLRGARWVILAWAALLAVSFASAAAAPRAAGAAGAAAVITGLAALYLYRRRA